MIFFPYEFSVISPIKKVQDWERQNFHNDHEPEIKLKPKGITCAKDANPMTINGLSV